MEPAERSLAEALKAGRPEAFEAFVDRFGPLVMNFGRRMCGHRDDAEDVVQETLLKSYLSLKRLRDPSALRTWVYRVAANACMRMRRHGAREPRRRISLDEVLPHSDGDASPPEIADWSGLPLDRLLQGELRGKLEKAILALPKPYRVVLVLRDQEGLSTREVARVLGITETASKVRLHRARLALRKELDVYLSGRAPGSEPPPGAGGARGAAPQPR